MAIRVFLSSRMKEFDQERAAIAFQIASLKGFEINAAEDWGALSAPVEHVYGAGVASCHIYIGLFGRTYSPHTHREYEEACSNPYRQKLIYLKAGARVSDESLTRLIATFESRHRPYRFQDLRDLQPRLLKDLELAVQEMLNQCLQLAEKAPVAQGAGPSVSEQAWHNRRKYLCELYRNDTDLTVDRLHSIRAALSHPPTGLFKRFAGLMRL